MGFMGSVEKELLNGEANRSRTENGALGYRTTGKNLLDLNFQTSSLRKKQPNEIVSKYVDAFLDNKLYALKWLFYLRDAREGLGERRSFRIIMNHLAKSEQDIAKALVALIPEYGRYDDLMCLFGTECEVFVLAVIKEQLNKDLEDMKANKPISLLGKWLPSCNASSKETREKGLLISKYLGLNEKGWFVDPISNTCWVKTGVRINGIEHIEDLPIMNFKNKSMTSAEVTSIDANKAIQRSLTKACARHGLGLYIYEGEDLPEEAKEEKKKQEKAKSELDIANAEAFQLAKELSKEHNTEVAAICKKYTTNGNPKTIKDIESTKALIDELNKLK